MSNQTTIVIPNESIAKYDEMQSIDRDGNLHIVSVGDGSTARAGYVWQSTTKRADGLHEHIYKRNDGK